MREAVTGKKDEESTLPSVGGAKRRRRSGSRARRSKKGGFAGAIEQAIVPFGLLAVQKRMQKRTSKNGDSRRRGFSRRGSRRRGSRRR